MVWDAVKEQKEKCLAGLLPRWPLKLATLGAIIAPTQAYRPSISNATDRRPTVELTIMKTLAKNEIAGTNDPLFRRVSSEAKPLTPALAQEYKSMKASPTERELQQPRVNHLLAKIKAGQAVAFQWAHAWFGGEVLRMNGNH
jgi:hypothetical protein